MSMSTEVRAIPNRGWDQRIFVFQYKRVVSAFVVVSERYVILLDTLVSPATAGVMLDAAADVGAGHAIDPAVLAARKVERDGRRL